MNAPLKGGDAVFTRGSTFRHVAVMSATGTVGLMAIFVVDLLSLLYISWLGDVNVTAGVGFATTVFFFSTSINVGLMIGVTAVVSRALGARDPVHARRLAGSSLAWMTLAAAAVGFGMMATLDPLLAALGAQGEAMRVAHRFLMITMPTNALMGLGMALGGLLRAAGDARRAMFVTLAGGLATAVIDPLLIFGLRLGADGAAIAIVAARIVFCIVGFHGAVKVHDMVPWPRLLHALEDFRPLAAIAVPAVLTNVATPVANGFLTGLVAHYGDEAVAANAIMTRLVPVAFGTVFALTGAVGPIFGQNLGARLFDRVRKTLTDGLVFTLLIVLLAWGVLYVGQDVIVHAFAAQGRTAELVRFFCNVIAASWIFHGALFVANSAFNNLGFPLLATGFNWGKATLGTLPFCWVGARLGGVEGIMLGQAVGALIFGVAGVWVAYRCVDRIARGLAPA
ncbi:MAG: MATE family efflux transporter [Alsobacter sp.]